MSPTSQILLDRPQTSGYGLLSENELLQYNLNALGWRASSVSDWTEILEYVCSANRYSPSASLPLTRRSEFWAASTIPATTPVEWLFEPFDLAVAQNDAEYLFENSLPESVPAEWVAEVERYRSIERADFVLPWNEDPPRDNVGG